MCHPVVTALVDKFGEEEQERIKRGVEQVSRLWRESDGTEEEFQNFCLTHFVKGKERKALFERLDHYLDRLNGLLRLASMEVREPIHEERTPLLTVDGLLARLNPGSHLVPDLFNAKVAFSVLLNFKYRPPSELLECGDNLSRQQWAAARLCSRFAHRVPAEVWQAVTNARTSAESYVSAYNLHLDHVVDKSGMTPFRRGCRLLSHWGLRDEIRALYSAGDEGVERQRIVQTVCERIVRQEIPACVIDSEEHQWDPVTNEVDGQAVDEDTREADVRYEKLKALFAASQLVDPFYPDAPTRLVRSFAMELEQSQERVEGLLRQVLAAPVGEKVAKVVQERLGRSLEPFDIWYDGFKPRSSISERELDEKVAARFPDAKSFEKELPVILSTLGFDEETVDFLAKSVRVDPARGSGHAMAPAFAGDKARLRTRVKESGMDYKGFNIAIHELGHNVEQLFSANCGDFRTLAGVPNTAFSEAFAFIFQGRDMKILGVENNDPKADSLRTIDFFNGTRELAAVALMDILVWQWLTDNPKAEASEVREAVIRAAGSIWDEYFVQFYGRPGCPLLAIYAHMTLCGLYLPNYPMGRLIGFQVEDYFKSQPLGQEMKRICAIGRLTPDQWMKEAVGCEISATPLIEATEKALLEIAGDEK